MYVWSLSSAFSLKDDGAGETLGNKFCVGIRFEASTLSIQIGKWNSPS